MLYLFYGNDTDALEKKVLVHTKKLQAEHGGSTGVGTGDAEITSLSSETITPEVLAELSSDQSLFGGRQLYRIRGAMESKEGKEMIVAAAKSLKESPNIFIFLEGALDKATLTKLEKQAEHVELFEKREAAKESFNIFALTDAFGRRDKKELWVLFQKALSANVSAEEMHGIIWWQLKTMLLVDSVKAQKNAAEASGLKPFVYSKALGFLRNYPSAELMNLGAGLVGLLHESRRGKGELEARLESFVLSL